MARNSAEATELHDSAILLSALPASAVHRRTALLVTLFLVASFLAVLPFARVTANSLPAFVVAQQSILAITDIITAVLLFGQYSISRSHGLNILAGGYLFTALIVIPHAMTFPGAFSPSGLLNAGPQGTAWLYLAWHAVLPLTIIAYRIYPKRDAVNEPSSVSAAKGILITVLAAVGAVMLLTLIATAAPETLPAVMAGNHFTNVARVAVGVVLGLTFTALLALACQRTRSVLNLWLMVVMFAWLCAIALGSFISKGRFDIGWYAGRIFAVLASTMVLIVLLSETIMLYARTVRSAASERRERERRLREMEAVLAHLARIGDLSQIVSSLIHELGQPLTAIGNYLDAGVHLVDATTSERLKQILERATEQTRRATGIILHLREFISGRSSEKQPNDIPEVLDDGARLALVGIHINAPVVEIHCDPGASYALFDRVQIEQVIFNLVRNAAEAMSGSRERALTITGTLNDGNIVEIRVADTGPGLSPEVRAKLFEPFVTTKASGLGVGLSICRFIIEDHGGRLWAEDHPGGGTVFCFTLPIAHISGKSGLVAMSGQ
jgi:signal transduction histidine kinase